MNTIDTFVKEILEFKNTVKSVNDSTDVKKYRSIVDIYRRLSYNFESLVNTFSSYNDIVDELNKFKKILDDSFNVIEDKQVIKEYLAELDNLDEMFEFYKSLDRFEQSLVSTPLLKLSKLEIDDVYNKATLYATMATSFVYFRNDPFIKDDIYHTSIPTRYEFTNKDVFLTDVHNYLLELYTSYLELNEQKLVEMQSIEHALKEKIFEYRLTISNAKNVEFDTLELSPKEYYEKVVTNLSELKKYRSVLLDSELFRFIDLMKLFEDVDSEFKKLEYKLESKEEYIIYKETLEFNDLVDELENTIKLLESGVIKTDKKYIVNKMNFRELVERIMELSEKLKLSITFSTAKKTYSFEYYQTGSFLSNIKEYYYNLLTSSRKEIRIISIDEYGDNTINNLRTKYKTALAEYNSFLDFDVRFMDEVEYRQFLNKVIEIQSELKSIAEQFFTAALKTSPSTFYEQIESNYKDLLEKMDNDILELSNKDDEIIIANKDPKRKETLEYLRSIKDELERIKAIEKYSRENVFIGESNYIKTKLEDTYESFYNVLEFNFDNADYTSLIHHYNNFFDAHTFDFNMLYALESLVDETTKIFEYESDLDEFYIMLQTNNMLELDIKTEQVLINLYDQPYNYNFIRNNLFSKLDNFYNYLISDRINEKQFLTNELNMKKIYFDNILLKLNYIYLYHSIKKNHINLLDYKVLENYDFYIDRIDFIKTFKYSNTLPILISKQYKLISMIKKNILTYDLNMQLPTIDLYNSINEYNTSFYNALEKYNNYIFDIKEAKKFIDLNNKKQNIQKIHNDAWTDIVSYNEIDAIDILSYDDYEPIKGNVPFNAVLRAKKNSETDSSTFEWDIDGNIFTGNEISYTFYKAGKYKVICTMITNESESSRFLEFNIDGPTNSQLVKSENVDYKPLKLVDNTPKLTMMDPETNTMKTVPLIIDGDISEMIKNGTISIADTDVLTKNTLGLVIFGFNGTTLPGDKFNYEAVMSEDFEYPEESEFLFDIHVSNPVVQNSVIDISDSKFVVEMYKIPKSQYKSIYSIDDASTFQPIGNKTPILIDDILVFKNTSGRYAAINITDIVDETKIEDESYFFEIKFDYFVNVSIDKNKKTNFAPQETKYVSPIITFKANVRELFYNLISNIEQIDKLKVELKVTKDVEKQSLIENKISVYEQNLDSFYIAKELVELKTKIQKLKSKLYYLDTSLNYDLNTLTNITSVNTNLSNIISTTKTFDEYMNCVHTYDFKSDAIDLGIIVNFLEKEKNLLEMYIATFKFNDENESFYTSMLVDYGFDYNLSGNTYIDKMINLVKYIRTEMYRVKLVVDFQLLTTDKYINLNAHFERLKKVGEKYEIQPEDDLFLLNKKLEFRYGYELDKVEEGKPNKSFISDIVEIVKSGVGVGLSQEEINDLGQYIETIEKTAVEAYDDFFLMSLWIDYLGKQK